MKVPRRSLALLISCMLSSYAFADEREELLKLRNTTLNLIELLVQQGILDKGKAEQMIKQAEQKAAVEAREEARKEKEVRESAAALAVPKPDATVQAGDQAKAVPPIAPGTVRVTYVPEFIKEEIRADVRKELKAEVVREVKAEAKEEKWGIPAALPDWVNRFHLYGDIRLRYEKDFFASDNPPNSYFNWPLINGKGGFFNTDYPFRNTTTDRQRSRVRFRLGLESEITDSLKAGVRLATSNDRNPVSINQTLGQYGQQYEIALDRAFLQYDYRDGQHYDWLTLWAGRMPNPWFSSDNMFDPDLNFEGLAGTFRLPFLQDDPGLRGYRPVQTQSPTTAGLQQFNMGFTRPNEAFLTLGLFPLQEVELSSKDKWLWAAQTGVDWLFDGDSRIKAGVAYYDYRNTQARRNPLGSTEFDYTAPLFFSQGNSLARISNDLDPELEPRRVGLASRFQVFDALLVYDYSGFDPYHIIFTANYSQNLGFDRTQILRTLGEDIAPKTRAFQVRLDIGEPNITKLNDWGVWLAYKYLERDSVLDAFTDSNFHLSGTNAKGWMAGINYGIAKNTWLNLRWLSAGIIDDPAGSLFRNEIPQGLGGAYDVNVLLVDLNARF